MINLSESLLLEQEIQRVISKQSRHGVAFAAGEAATLSDFLLRRLEHLKEGIQTQLDSEVIRGTPVTKPYKKDGTLTKRVQDWFKKPVEISGPFTKVSFAKPLPTQRAKIAAQLVRGGWKPEEFSPGGTPRMTKGGIPVDTLKGTPLGNRLADFYLKAHRRALIDGLREQVWSDENCVYRISAGAIVCGTNTGRMRHRGVVNIPKASPKVYLGTKIRSLFTVPKGYKMVGVDAAGLELRMLCHYMDDPDYTKMLLEGDIHTHNQKLAGLPDRDKAKTFILIARIT